MDLSNPRLRVRCEYELGVNDFLSTKNKNSELDVKSIPHKIFGDYFVMVSITVSADCAPQAVFFIDATNMIFLQADILILQNSAARAMHCVISANSELSVNSENFENAIPS